MTTKGMNNKNHTFIFFLRRILLLLMIDMLKLLKSFC